MLIPLLRTKSPNSLFHVNSGMHGLHFSTVYSFLISNYPSDALVYFYQGSRVFKDFDIVKEAGSSFRATSKDYKVQVSENYLEIHFFWGGKGSCCIPDPSTFGPLISAITATPGNLYNAIQSTA